jgi:uncharacterized membrane protein YgcG
MTTIRHASAALLVLLATLVPATAAERILLFVSDVEVQRNSDLLVTETIRLQAEGEEIRHGPFRDFPTIYTRRDGTRVRVGFDVLSITRDGSPEPYSTERIGNGVRIKIGSAEVMLPTGQHQYVIKYRATREIGFFSDYDELYWNATGNGWVFPIDVAEARIRLPEAVRFIQYAFYTGPQGASGKDAAVTEQRPGFIAFRTTQPLPAKNGLTVSAAWPKGIVTPPNDAQRSGALLNDNSPLLVAALGMLIVFAYYFYAWRRAGRDPSRGTIIPLFGPPNNMSAAAVRYVRRMDFDDRAFTAAVLDLAVRGHLKLVEADKVMSVERQAGGKAIAGPEQALEGKLFPGDATNLRLVQTNHKFLGRAREALSQALDQLYEDKLFHTHQGWSIGGAVLSLVVIGITWLAVATAWGAEEAQAVLAGYFYLGPLALVLGYIAYTGLTGHIWKFVGHFAVVIFAVIWAFQIGDTLDIFPSLLQTSPVAMPLVLLPLAASAFSWMKAHTREGRRITDQIEGFRQYLGVAEEARLEALNPPDKTPELFERFLPYAVALDVENHWARRFAGVLAAAAAAGTAATWYSGNYDWGHDPVGFADHLGGHLENTIAAAATAPGSSSGSGGSGFSGGGGGGGGGGGW